MRGIGSNANTELGDPAIAPHLDDVYVPRPRGLGVAFFDIERVEVNVGPQGTVRGRNALGGSINIVSRKPKLGEFEGYAESAVGDYDQQELRGALNVPLGKIAAARLAVYSSEHDEYVRNTGPLTNLLGWESQDDVGARAALPDRAERPASRCCCPATTSIRAAPARAASTCSTRRPGPDLRRLRRSAARST